MTLSPSIPVAEEATSSRRLDFSSSSPQRDTLGLLGGSGGGRRLSGEGASSSGGGGGAVSPPVRDEAFWIEFDRLWGRRMMAFLSRRFRQLSYEDVGECWNDTLLQMYKYESVNGMPDSGDSISFNCPLGRLLCFMAVCLAIRRLRRLAVRSRVIREKALDFKLSWRSGLGVYNKRGDLLDVFTIDSPDVYSLDLRAEALALAVSRGFLTKWDMEKLDKLRAACESGEYNPWRPGARKVDICGDPRGLIGRCRTVLFEIGGAM